MKYSFTDKSIPNSTIKQSQILCPIFCCILHTVCHKKLKYRGKRAMLKMLVKLTSGGTRGMNQFHHESDIFAHNFKLSILLYFDCKSRVCWSSSSESKKEEKSLRNQKEGKRIEILKLVSGIRTLLGYSGLLLGSSPISQATSNKTAHFKMTLKSLSFYVYKVTPRAVTVVLNFFWLATNILEKYIWWQIIAEKIV
jgi:hypothetical protein